METGKNTSESPRSMGHYHDDEISLVDLALVLIRRKWWVIGVFLVSMLAGTAYWQMQVPEQYYTTSVQTGTYQLDTDIKLVEEQRDTVSFLEIPMIPKARQSMAEKNKMPESDVPQIKIKTGESKHLILESRGQDLDPVLVHDLHQMVVDSIVSRHDTILLEEMRSQLNSLKANQDIVQLKIDHVDEYISFLNHQKLQFTQLLDVSQELEKESLEGNFLDPNLAMALFVRGSLSADLLDRLGSIQKETHDGTRDRAQLQLEMNQSQLEIENAEHDISRLIDKEDGIFGRFVPTRASGVADAKQEGTGGGRMILALSVVLGLMLGVFSAFFLEFVARVRETVLQQNDQ